LPLPVKIQIYDTKGALQLTSNDTLIDVSILAKGVYSILIYAQDGHIAQTSKLVIE